MVEECLLDNQEKKRRGRKKKNDKSDDLVVENVVYTIEDNEDNTHIAKKRGRKPRGGKLILKPPEPINDNNSISNIILHLKCSLNDLNDYQSRMSKLVTDPLKYKPDIPTEILTYNDTDNVFSLVNNIYSKDYGTEDEQNTSLSETQISNSDDVDKNTIKNLLNVLQPSSSKTGVFCSSCIQQINNNADILLEDDDNENINMKDINSKIKQLKIMLYKNSLQSDKKSACFWDTCEFDNTPCHIPLYEKEGVIYGYGSFCRPECGVAYLFRENLDDSTKFERYNMLNQIYGKAYNCKKNVKPAPNPYYLLDKFYGNLSIQEYRKLLKTESLLLVLDKPFTRILPELHEDNDELVMNIYGMNKQNNNVSGVYKVKRQSEKQQGPCKSSIMKNKFFQTE